MNSSNRLWAAVSLVSGLHLLSACGGQAGPLGGSSAGGGSGGSGSSGDGAAGRAGMSGSAGLGGVGTAGAGGMTGGLGSGCQLSGCSSQLCRNLGDALSSTCEWREEYACYRAATCERQSDGQCGWTQTQSLTECIAQARGGSFEWYQSCGAPVCGPNDATGAPACDLQREGAACTSGEPSCDPGLGCGVLLVCADSDPRLQPGGCPISRRRFKRDVTALSEVERQRLSDELLRLPLVAYRYQGGRGEPQLGFVIEDVAPSYAVDAARDQVNLYGYTSLAVLALQEQQRTIVEQRRQLAEQARRLDALERQLRALLRPDPRK